jgi:hypothetical protein
MSVHDKKRKLYKLSKVLRRLKNKHKKLSIRTDYYYLSMLMKKSVVSHFAHKNEINSFKYCDIKPITASMLKPHYEWTSIEFELINNPDVYLTIHTDSVSMCQSVYKECKDNSIDPYNIYYTKLNFNKPFTFDLSNTNEIWLLENEAITNPSRLTPNKFYNNYVQLFNITLHEDTVTAVYQNIEQYIKTNIPYVIEIIINLPRSEYDKLPQGSFNIGSINNIFKYTFNLYRAPKTIVTTP